MCSERLSRNTLASDLGLLHKVVNREPAGVVPAQKNRQRQLARARQLALRAPEKGFNAVRRELAHVLKEGRITIEDASRSQRARDIPWTILALGHSEMRLRRGG